MNFKSKNYLSSRNILEPYGSYREAPSLDFNNIFNNLPLDENELAFLQDSVRYSSGYKVKK